LPETASLHDWYAALAYTVRDRMLQRWNKTVHTFIRQDTRVVGYLSAEFLMGPHLGNALINLGIYEQAR
jgi:starch phosphorylase